VHGHRLQLLLAQVAAAAEKDLKLIDSVEVRTVLMARPIDDDEGLWAPEHIGSAADVVVYRLGIADTLQSDFIRRDGDHHSNLQK
jgi:hypothetical protein